MLAARVFPTSRFRGIELGGMAYDLAPLKSYVRFYQNVVKQLSGAWSALADTQASTATTFAPFVELLSALPAGEVGTQTQRVTSSSPGLNALWTPEDATELSGLTDVYTVVGRFSFQGPDDENLQRVSQIVAEARTEVQTQQALLEAVASLPERVRSETATLVAHQSTAAHAARQQKLEGFGPLVDRLHSRATKSMEALRVVPVPELASVETAADDYRTFVLKLSRVYATCLKFLREDLAALYDHAGLQVPESWPDELPVVDEIPQDLVLVPSDDSPELLKIRRGLESLEAEAKELEKALGEAEVLQKRIAGELEVLATKDHAALEEIERAMKLLAYATALEEIVLAQARVEQLENQRAERTKVLGEVRKRAAERYGAIQTLEAQLSTQQQTVDEATHRLQHEKDNEPTLFGRDSWRKRLAEAEEELETTTQQLGQRQAMLNQLRIEASTVAAEAQTEEAQLALIQGWLADAQASIRTNRAKAEELDTWLGPSRAIHAPTRAEAGQVLTNAQTARDAIVEEIQDGKTLQRRKGDEITKSRARLEQIDVQRRKVAGLEKSVKVAAQSGRDEALKQLAIRRASAVRRHVDEVLTELDASFDAMDQVFVDPARKAMLDALEPDPELPAKLQRMATELDELVAVVSQELSPVLQAQRDLVEQAQREFCDVAAEACRNAWLGRPWAAA